TSAAGGGECDGTDCLNVTTGAGGVLRGESDEADRHACGGGVHHGHPAVELGGGEQCRLVRPGQPAGQVHGDDPVGTFILQPAVGGGELGRCRTRRGHRHPALL